VDSSSTTWRAPREGPPEDALEIREGIRDFKDEVEVGGEEE